MDRKSDGSDNFEKLLLRSQEVNHRVFELKQYESISSQQAKGNYQNFVPKSVTKKQFPPLDFISKLIKLFEENEGLHYQKNQDMQNGKFVVNTELLKEDFNILHTLLKSLEKARGMKAKIKDISDSVSVCLNNINYNYLRRDDYEAHIPKITIQIKMTDGIQNHFSKLIEEPWEENRICFFKFLYLRKFIEASGVSPSLEIDLILILNILDRINENMNSNFKYFEAVCDFSKKSSSHKVTKWELNLDFYMKIQEFISKIEINKPIFIQLEEEFEINNQEIDENKILLRTTISRSKFKEKYLPYPKQEIKEKEKSVLKEKAIDSLFNSPYPKPSESQAQSKTTISELKDSGKIEKKGAFNFDEKIDDFILEKLLSDYDDDIKKVVHEKVIKKRDIPDEQTLKFLKKDQKTFLELSSKFTKKINFTLKDLRLIIFYLKKLKIDYNSESEIHDKALGNSITENLWNENKNKYQEYRNILYNNNLSKF